MDKNGNFAKLPENVDGYLSPTTFAVSSSKPYQKFQQQHKKRLLYPNTKPVVVVEPQIQRKTVQLPAKATERSK